MAKAKKEKKAARSKGNIVRGPALRENVRVPIDPVSYQKKESEHAQLAVQVRKIERKIKPDKIKIAGLKDQMKDLETDIEENTEERELMVTREYHYDTSEVRFFDAKTNKEIGERRTMTAEERKRNSDIEDKKGGIVAGKAGAKLRLSNPVLTPGEAVAAARATKGSRKAKNPAFQDAVDASDAAVAHAEGYNDPAEGAEEANA